MARASTHRLKSEVQVGLDNLSKALRRPKNKLINEAVHAYVQQKSREVEQEMEASLRALRTYRKGILILKRSLMILWLPR